MGTARSMDLEDEGVVQRPRKKHGEAPGRVRSHVRSEGSGLSAC